MKLTRGCGIGSGVHRIRATERARIGAITYRVVVDVVGSRGSLVKSFIASAIGWSIPYGPMVLGPLRSCM